MFKYYIYFICIIYIKIIFIEYILRNKSIFENKLNIMNFGYIVVSVFSRNFLSKFTILISLIIISSHLHAQIDIKSKVDAQTYSEYSKAIDLLSKTFPFQGSSLTVFIPDNYSINRIAPESFSKIFIENNTNDVINYLNKYVLNEKLNHLTIQTVIDSGVGFNKLNYNNETLYFTKHRDLVMVSNNLSYEAHVKSVINFDSNISLIFLIGGF